MSLLRIYILLNSSVLRLFIFRFIQRLEEGEEQSLGLEVFSIEDSSEAPTNGEPKTVKYKIISPGSNTYFNLSKNINEFDQLELKVITRLIPLLQGTQ